jgi:hypothetical protein
LKSDFDDDYTEYVPLDETAEDADESLEPDESDVGLEHDIDKIAPDNFPQDHAHDPRDKEIEFPHATAPEEHPISMTTKISTPSPQANADDASNYVLVISANKSSCVDFMKSVIAKEPEEIYIRAFDSPLYSASMPLENGTQLSLIGAQPNEQFSVFLDYFNDKAQGCVFLLALDALNWSYNRYLIRTTSERLAVNTLIVGKQTRMNNDFNVQDIRDKLALDEHQKMTVVSSLDDSPGILNTLLNEFRTDPTAHDSQRVMTK